MKEETTWLNKIEVPNLGVIFVMISCLIAGFIFGSNLK